MKPGQPFADLPALAVHLRNELENKKVILLYAYNGTGKTRLSMKFKDLGRRGDTRDTLYFNAFTEDLFHWDNDLDGDSDRRLTLNAERTIALFRRPGRTGNGQPHPPVTTTLRGFRFQNRLREMGCCFLAKGQEQELCSWLKKTHANV